MKLTKEKELEIENYYQEKYKDLEHGMYEVGFDNLIAHTGKQGFILSKIVEGKILYENFDIDPTVKGLMKQIEEGNKFEIHSIEDLITKSVNMFLHGRK